MEVPRWWGGGAARARTNYLTLFFPDVAWVKARRASLPLRSDRVHSTSPGSERFLGCISSRKRDPSPLGKTSLIRLRTASLLVPFLPNTRVECSLACRAAGNFNYFVFFPFMDCCSWRSKVSNSSLMILIQFNSQELILLDDSGNTQRNLVFFTVSMLIRSSEAI